MTGGPDTITSSAADRAGTLEEAMAADELGPHKVVLVRRPAAGLEGFVVVDNVAAGPAIGGLRMSATVSLSEVTRLARAMTLKNAMARLPHGGAKAGIVLDPTVARDVKEGVVRAFAREIAGLVEYVPGPDMGTDETAMAWVYDEIGRAVGLPRVLGGIPLDEIGATGYGLSVCAGAAAEVLGMELNGATAVIQGFGAVGRHAARFLAEKGVVVVAVADSRGAITSSTGLDVDELIRHRAAMGTVAGLVGTAPISTEDLVALPCDLWIPAAIPDVIRGDNAATVAARVVLPGANIAVTAEADAILFERKVVSIPDYVANAGGVICAAVEHRGGTQTQAFALIEETIRANTIEVLTAAKEASVAPRAAADRIALARVREAESYRR